MAESARQRWEYRFERYYPDDANADGEHRGSGLSTHDAGKLLAELGADGWELVAVAAIMPYELIFKRPLVEDDPDRLCCGNPNACTKATCPNDLAERTMAPREGAEKK